MASAHFNDKGQELCASCSKPLSPYWTTRCLHCKAPITEDPVARRARLAERIDQPGWESELPVLVVLLFAMLAFALVVGTMLAVD